MAVKDSRSSAWAARVLREHGAAVQEQRFPDWLSPSGNTGTHQSGRTADRGSEEGELRSRWATMATLLLQQGLLEPPDLLALLLTSRGLPDAMPDDEKRRQLREADEELREVTERLEAGLRARHPELFDRRGRLRPAALARRLVEQTGGKEVLSGDELRVLEDAADAAAARSGRAP